MFSSDTNQRPTPIPIKLLKEETSRTSERSVVKENTSPVPSCVFRYTPEEQKMKDYFLNNIREVVSPGDKVNEVIGNDDAKADIKLAILACTTGNSLVEDELKWNAMLLAGPSGTGKTTILRSAAVNAANAVNCQISVFALSMTDLMSKWFGGSEKQIKVLFQAAVEHSPSLLLFDEVDCIMSSRKGTDSEAGGRMKNSLLSALRGFKKNSGTFVLATTNRPWCLDSAFISRFHRAYYVGLPSTDHRQQIFKMLLSHHFCINATNLTTFNIEMLAKKTKGYSGDEIRKVISNAAHFSLRYVTDGVNITLREWLSGGNDVNVSGVVQSNITTELLLQVIQKTKPNTNKQQLRELLSWANKYSDNRATRTFEGKNVNLKRLSANTLKYKLCCCVSCGHTC